MEVHVRKAAFSDWYSVVADHPLPFCMAFQLAAQQLGANARFPNDIELYVETLPKVCIPRGVSSIGQDATLTSNAHKFHRHM